MAAHAGHGGRFVVLTGFGRDRSFGTPVGRRAAAHGGPGRPPVRHRKRGTPTIIEANA